MLRSARWTSETVALTWSPFFSPLTTMLPVSVSGPALIDVSTARVLSSLRVTVNQSPVLV